MLSRNLSYKDTILNVKCDIDLFDKILEEVIAQRRHIEDYIIKHPEFRTSLEPIDVKSNFAIINDMAYAAKVAGVGPMAAVAGAIAEFAARRAVKSGAKAVLVENGGDICLWGNRDFDIKIFAGNSRISEKLGFSINPRGFFGICTSSGTVGPSISLGCSDATVVCAKKASIADAAATAIGNCVKGDDGINAGLELAKKINEIDGVLIIQGEKVGIWGKLPEMIKLD